MTLLLGDNNKNSTHNKTSDDKNSDASRDLKLHFATVRNQSLKLAAPLSDTDMCIQSMPDASPIRWHLAHTTWFFEAFVLHQLPDFAPHEPSYNYLFNSYYNGIGAQFPRHLRGTQTRPTVSEILAWRAIVDNQILELIDKLESVPPELANTIVLGLHHEQQHQELMLTDIKHALWQNPLYPRYTDTPIPPSSQPLTSTNHWLTLDAGLYEAGHHGESFSFDNERPRHQHYLHSLAIAARPTTNREYLEFIEDGGYQTPQLWLSDGWHWVNTENIQAPLYWLKDDATEAATEWRQFTLRGLQPLALDAPVTHISFYEAQAYAAWKGMRLPTEFEWEVAAAHHAPKNQNEAVGIFVESGHLAPQQHPGFGFLGNVWEWTSSAYSPYPGFKPFAGNAGEYNGKFMCNQYVLRGGSCATPRHHIRHTYRNFFYPQQRWQFTGIRLANH